MQLAALFWFYDHLDVCEDRLKLLRALNPAVPVYGLYGGDLEREAEARRRLGPRLDDFYAFAELREPSWKWRHGDRLIAAWHRDRGGSLAWDTIVVVQWDMLLLAPLHRLFGHLREGEALFSGLRPQAEVAHWWGWLDGKDPDKRQDMVAFKDLLARDFGYDGEVWACLFIVVALPRRFLDLYLAAGPPEAGFLEYKLPTLARVFGVPAADASSFRPWWAAEPATRNAPRRDRVLNAMNQTVPLRTVLAETVRKRGARVFHPFRKRFPSWRAWRLAALVGLSARG